MISHNDPPFWSMNAAIRYARGISEDEQRYTCVVELRGGKQWEVRYDRDKPTDHDEWRRIAWDCGIRIL